MMSSIETNDDLHLSSLRWRCRRGMLELDLMLQAFVEQDLETLSEQERVVFNRLLDYPDQVLLELFLKQAVSSDREVGKFVERIRNAVKS